MNRVAKTDLEGCMKELADRLRRDLEGMTPWKRTNTSCAGRSSISSERAHLLRPPQRSTSRPTRQKRTTRSTEGQYPQPCDPRVAAQEWLKALTVRQFR